MLKYFIAAVFFVLCIFLGTTFTSIIFKWREEHFVCDTNLVVEKEDKSLSVAISYFINGSSGIAVLKGNLKVNDKGYSISRRSYFTLEKEQGLIHVKSTLAAATPADNAPLSELDKVLPQFYLKKDKKMDFSIYYQGWGGYIFSTGYVPSFYCKRVSKVSSV